jgi:hypothetical protein
MDLRKLKTLIDLVSDSNVTELEITEAEGTVRIVKGSNTGYAQNAGIQTIAVQQAPQSTPIAPTPIAALRPTKPPLQKLAHPHIQLSHPWWAAFTEQPALGPNLLWKLGMWSRLAIQFASLKQ